MLPVLFGMAQHWSGSSQAALVSLLALTIASLVWLQIAIAKSSAIKAAPLEGEPALGTQTAS